MNRKHLSVIILAAAAGALVSAPLLLIRPAVAFPVFDATNYAQNVLQAARALQQIDNQIQSLQHEMVMLQNMAKDLQTIDFPQLARMTESLQQIDWLMGQAQGIGFRLADLDVRFKAAFPDSFDVRIGTNQRVQEARARLDASMAALRHTMGVQAQVAQNVDEDARVLAELVAKSQGAEGNLQVQQAANQLLALTAKQQLQIQTLMAAQGRSDAQEKARRIQEESEAQAATQRFLGAGTAYTPR